MCCRASRGRASIVEKAHGASAVTGNVGIYFAAYRLSLMSWNVMPTARIARGIDLLAYDATASRFLGIHVKTLSKTRPPPVPLGISIETFLGDWWIIVTKITTDKPECFIMKPDEVRRLAHRGEKDGRISYWLQPNKYQTNEFREAWDRIGPGSTPLTPTGLQPRPIP
jgi:hypothetical protein